MTTTAVPEHAAGEHELLPETLSTRKVPRLERVVGPENYRIVKGLLTTPASIAGLILLVSFLLIALFAPVLAPSKARDPYKIPRDGFSPNPQPPGTVWKRNPPPVPTWYKLVTGNDQWVHLMGTASGQWDIFYGVVWGTRTAFKTGFIIVFTCLIIGVLFGSIAGYFGGMVDNVMMRVVDIFLTLPFIMAALIFTAVLTPRIGRSIIPAVLALIAFSWMSYARLIRGDILTVKERDFILAARVVGVKDRNILFKHIIPNAVFPTMVYATLDIGAVVLTFAALSFLGIGTDIGYADWGQLLSFARAWIPTLYDYWYIVFFPGIALILFILGWNLVGDALRDVLDPKMRGRI